ncbi:MAG: hypothetical protein ACRCUY_04125 [Thermoguttaceae bacterium]
MGKSHTLHRETQKGLHQQELTAIHRCFVCYDISSATIWDSSFYQIGGVSATKMFRVIQGHSVGLLEAIWSVEGQAIAKELLRIDEHLEKIKPQRRRKRHPSTREKLLFYRSKPLS